MKDIEKFQASAEKLDKVDSAKKWAGKGKTFTNLLDAYKSTHQAKFKMDFKPWLPNLANVMSPLAPGQMFCMLADTGGGKTAVMQQMILKVCAPLKTVLIEMELPDEDLMQRFIAMKALIPSKHSEEYAKAGKADHMIPSFDHLIVYSHMKFGIKEIEEIIDYEQPQVVIIDYLGLIRAEGKSRYERLSDFSEEIKLLAMTKKVIMIASCQIHRDSKRTTPEIFLHDARDSSSIENSAQKMIGIWREGDRGELIKIKVLKNQGARDMIFTYNFNNENLNIWNG